jgi:hypothetical protein
VAPAIESQTDPFAYTLVQQWTENELIVPTSNFNIYTEKIVNLSAYANQFVYVSFVKEFFQIGPGTGGDTWFIDNVRIGTGSLGPPGGLTFDDCWDGHSTASLTNYTAIPGAWL